VVFLSGRILPRTSGIFTYFLVSGYIISVKRDPLFKDADKVTLALETLAKKLRRAEARRQFKEKFLKVVYAR